MARLAKNNVIDGPVGVSNRIKAFAASSLKQPHYHLAGSFFASRTIKLVCIPPGPVQEMEPLRKLEKVSARLSLNLSETRNDRNL